MALASYSVNWLAVLVASIVSFIVGWLWYGPLFGKLWMKLNGYTEAGMKKSQNKSMASLMILNFVGTLITAYVLATLLMAVGVASVSDSIVLSFWIWLGFLATTTLLGGVLWENKSWGLFVLNGAYWLVTLEILAVVIYWFS